MIQSLLKTLQRLLNEKTGIKALFTGIFFHVLFAILSHADLLHIPLISLLGHEHSLMQV